MNEEKIFLVTLHSWDGSTFLGAFSDIEKAKSLISENEMGESHYYTNLTIDEIIIDKKIIGSSSRVETGVNSFTLKKFVYSEQLDFKNTTD